MKLKIVDNSGGLIARLIRPFRQKEGKVGDTVKVSLIEVLPNRKVKKGELYDALIVRSRQPIRRFDGGYLSFSETSVILLAPDHSPLATRFSGPFPLELLSHSKIAQLITHFL
jgi:large subunit ribosomal protein L14